MALNEKSPTTGLATITGKHGQDTENFPPTKEYAVNPPNTDDLDNIFGENIKEAEDYLSKALEHLVPQDEEIPAPESVFSLDGDPILTKKSLSAVIAKAKQGKTTVVVWLVAQMLVGAKVLWVDTEQGLYYSSRTQHWVLDIAGHEYARNLYFFDFKIFPPDERIKLVDALLDAGDYDILVIDGIRDLLFDINSPEEATIISTHLMRWAEMHNIHIINVLHTNKGDGNARGHLGSELVNKAETVLKVELEDETKNILVTPEFTRGKPFDDFALYRDENGVPCLMDGWEKKEKEKGRRRALLPVDIAPETHREILEKVFSGGSLLYGELLPALSAAFGAYGVGMGENKAKTFIAHYMQNGQIEKTVTGRKSAYTLK